MTRAVRATPGSNMGWRVTVAPSGDGDVEIGFRRESAANRTRCVSEAGHWSRLRRRRYRERLQSNRPRPQVPLTASFSGAPAEHTGNGSFELQFRLSEEPAGLSYRTVHNGLFNVTGASIGRAWRLQKGNNARLGASCRTLRLRRRDAHASRNDGLRG